MKIELKPCPFCGGKPDVFRSDRLFTIGCKRCGIEMGFPGWLQTKPKGDPVSAEGSAVKEYYHGEAWDNAVDAWNRRDADD